MLGNIDAATRVPICIRLKRTVNRVLTAMENARGDPSPDWERFAGDYQRLAFETSLENTLRCQLAWESWAMTCAK